MKLLSVAEVGVITVVGVVGVVSVVGVVGVCFSFFSLKRTPFLFYENTVFPTQAEYSYFFCRF